MVTNRRQRRAWILALPIGAMVAAAVVIGVHSASADGIPATNPLFYSGRITENGAAANGTRSIVIDLWDDATSADTAHRKCETVAPSTTITNGSFRVALDPGCLAAVHANRDVWIEVFVGTASLGRRKVGAVPYAVEAAHAADVPASALVLPSSLITTTTGNLTDERNNSTKSVAGQWWTIPGRSLTFNKRYATSKLKVTYQDTLGTFGHFYAGCEWQIVLDGTAIAFFSDADGDTPTDVWKMSNAAHVAWAGGAVGSHTVIVQNHGRADRGAWAGGTGECLQGWNTTGNFLSVEEIP